MSEILNWLKTEFSAVLFCDSVRRDGVLPTHFITPTANFMKINLRLAASVLAFTHAYWHLFALKHTPVRT